ncbi:DNA mismatch repair protein MutS-like protein [Anaeromyxobacter dehalogenans 2CP-C]|uniref:DNA mismatch repair protein MutS-like protein n=1 Tax=Anaeromyxobacter dehalogenans (strain 2CP-C) TaxID=290397 RepID=Q2INF6_ANADE|nr:DNA mismatch repair protein MutS-like protein [Anaeromyxobacter dehalogenans 2CP-C]
MRGWLTALGEMEALAALATRVYENPAEQFPEVVSTGTMLDAQELGHPLLPVERCVRNDVRLGGTAPQLILLSGSNMSGKSTLLRALGASAALALAGGTVRARRMVLSPVALCASLRVQDSVLDGASRFQAEVLRLCDVARFAAGPHAVLFLLDEILGGTNSDDRLRGAKGVLTALVNRGAIGVCTTHDLALTRIADELGARATNAHLVDALVGGKLAFDYRLRPGVVRRSNAIEWMRLVGLEV